MTLCANNTPSTNEYTGNGAITEYSITFQYYSQSDIFVAFYDTAAEAWVTVSTSDWYFLNPTVIKFNTAPADNQRILIYRCTDIDPLPAEFFPGNSIKAADLNNNFFVMKSAIEEINTQAGTSDTLAQSAKATADAANTKATNAVNTANTALATANIADTNATNALNVANNATATQISSNPPSNPSPGNVWFDSDTGKTFIYYQDSDSSQWVDLCPPLDSDYSFPGSGVVRDVSDRLKDYVSVKDFGAVGDGVANDTAAIANALAASRAVFFPAGIYNTDPIIVKDQRGRSIFAEGSFDPVQPNVILRPRTDQSAINTFIELGSSAYIRIQGIAFVCASKVVKTLVHIRANSDLNQPAPGTLRVKFEECGFLVGDSSTLQPEKTVRMSNSGQIDFVRCFFEGGSPTEFDDNASVAVELGEPNATNPGTGQAPYGDGGTSQTVFDCCYFKGDVVRLNADHSEWHNCNFYGKPFNSNKVSRVLAPTGVVNTAYEKFDNCYLDTFVTTDYTGTWYTQGAIGHVEFSNTLIAGYNKLLHITAGKIKAFGNRFLSLGTASNRSCIHLASTAGANAEIFGNDISQIESINTVGNVNVQFIDDDRGQSTYQHFESRTGTDFTITTTPSDLFTYSYKSSGTYVKVRAQLALKHLSSNARRYEFKIQYKGITRGSKRQVTLVTLNEIYSFAMEQTIYLPAEGQAEDLTIEISTTADTGAILKSDSWWSVEKVYC